MPIYLKMTEGHGDHKNGVIVDIDQAKSELDAMVLATEEGSCEECKPSFTFTAVEMTEEEFNNLEEFPGF